jgi:hypothetical protein
MKTEREGVAAGRARLELPGLDPLDVKDRVSEQDLFGGCATASVQKTLQGGLWGADKLLAFRGWRGVGKLRIDLESTTDGSGGGIVRFQSSGVIGSIYQKSSACLTVERAHLGTCPGDRLVSSERSNPLVGRDQSKGSGEPMGVIEYRLCQKTHVSPSLWWRRVGGSYRSFCSGCSAVSNPCGSIFGWAHRAAASAS